VKCADCKFWKSEDGFAPDHILGACRRYAPRPMAEMALQLILNLTSEGSVTMGDDGYYADAAVWREHVWPTTSAKDFCGEFTAARDPVF
jgi:hypothetical protein